MKSSHVLRVLAVCAALSFTLAVAHAQDIWQGGYGGYWSNGSNWTTGLPAPANNVVIYTGGDDLVYLDVSPAINSLTLGGAYTGYYSELSDNGIAQTLTISQSLTINQNGNLQLSGNTTVTAGADSVNAGNITAYAGSLISISGNFDNQGIAGLGGAFSATGTFTNEAGAYSFFDGAGSNLGAFANNGYLGVGLGTALTVAGGPLVTDIPSTANYQIAGTFTIGGSDAFASLTSIEGILNLYSQSTNVMPVGGTLTVASGAQLAANNGTNLMINGNLDNSGYVSTNGGYGGANTLTITGSVANQAYATFSIGGSGDTAAISGNLTNYGFITMEFQGKLIVNGTVTNSGQISDLLCECEGGQNTLTFNSLFTNTSTGQVNLVGLGDVLQVAGDVNNSGSIWLADRDTFTVNGKVNNSGQLTTGGEETAGGNTLTFTGLLTNTPAGQVNLNGPGDLLQANGGIANSGSIWVNNGSTVDPPFLNNLGAVNIDATSTFVVGTGTPKGVGYVQLANGTLGEMISSSAFGVINASGPASLNGTLDILLQGGFNPKVGATYEIILFSPGGLTGAFASIQNDIFNNDTEYWKITYDNANGFVDLTAAPYASTTPEPGSFLLLGTGFIGLSYGMRRRSKRLGHRLPHSVRDFCGCPIVSCSLRKGGNTELPRANEPPARPGPQVAICFSRGCKPAQTVPI